MINQWRGMKKMKRVKTRFSWRALRTKKVLSNTADLVDLEYYKYFVRIKDWQTNSYVS